MIRTDYPSLVLCLWCLFLVVSCGDELVDSTYRGVPLFEVTGTIEAAPEFDGADYVCSFGLNECFDGCADAELNLDPEATPDESAEAADCWTRCDARQRKCLQDYEGTDFYSAYYEKTHTQRIAILWANPKGGQGANRSGGPVLQQRSVTSTAFPARYTFSIYQPPPENALFRTGDVAYAYGMIVTFYDLNNDSILDIENESIIGFNNTNGVLYTAGPIQDLGPDKKEIPAGYRLYTASSSCSGTDFLQPPAMGALDQNTNLVISGATPAIFDHLPDVACDNDQGEWLDLCAAFTHRARCTAETPLSIYEPICAFCAGRTQTLYDDAVQPESPGPDDTIDGECTEGDFAEQTRCQAALDHMTCLTQATTDIEIQACEDEYERRLQELDEEVGEMSGSDPLP